MTIEELLKVEIDYMFGLNYMQNGDYNYSLIPIYIERLKEIKEELLNLKKENETKRGK